MRKAVNKDGTRQTRVIKKVLELRDEKSQSWTNIKLAIRKLTGDDTLSGTTVRRIYDEGHGRKDAHKDSRPLKGGRYPGDRHPDGTTGHQPKQDKPAEKAAPAKATAKKVTAKKAPATKKATPKATAGKATRATRKPAATKAPAPKPSVEDERRQRAAEAAEG